MEEGTFYYLLLLYCVKAGHSDEAMIGCDVETISPGTLRDCTIIQGTVPSGTECILQCPYSTRETNITCIEGSWKNQHIEFCSNKHEEWMKKRHQEDLRRHTRSVDDLCLNGFCASILRCNSRPSIQHGYYICHPDSYSNTQYRGKCRFGCYEGYRLMGSDTVTCQSSSVWSTAFPTCQKITCSSLPSPTAALKYLCTDGFNYGSVCTFECPAGYDIHPETMGAIRCPAYGYWTGPVARCIDIEPPVLSNCEYEVKAYADRNSTSTVLTWQEPVVSDNHDVNVPLIVKGDYSPGDVIPAGNYVVIYSAKDATGNHGNTCKTQINVEVLRCPEIHPTPYMTVTCPQGFIYGAECTFECMTNTKIIGPSKITCEKSVAGNYAEWSFGDGQPLCEVVAVVEDPLPVPQHGSLRCDYVYGKKVCQMSCDQGYTVPPDYPILDLVVLGDSGQWAPSSMLPFPDCKRISEASGAVIHFVAQYTLPSLCDNSISIPAVKEKFNSSVEASSLRSTCVKYAKDCILTTIDLTCDPTTSNILNLAFSIKFTLDRSTFVKDFETLQVHQTHILQSLQNSTSTGVLNLDLGSSTTANAKNVNFIETTLMCPNGMVVSYQTTSCVACPPGTYHNTSLMKCELCPLGEYQETEGQMSCLVCPASTTTKQKGAFTVSNCV